MSTAGEQGLSTTGRDRDSDTNAKHNFPESRGSYSSINGTGERDTGIYAGMAATSLLNKTKRGAHCCNDHSDPACH